MPTTTLCAGSVIYNCTNSTAVLTTEGIIGTAIGGFFFVLIIVIFIICCCCCAKKCGCQQTSSNTVVHPYMNHSNPSINVAPHKEPSKPAYVRPSIPEQTAKPKPVVVQRPVVINNRKPPTTKPVYVGPPAPTPVPQPVVKPRPPEKEPEVIMPPTEEVKPTPIQETWEPIPELPTTCEPPPIEDVKPTPIQETWEPIPELPTTYEPSNTEYVEERPYEETGNYDEYYK